MFANRFTVLADACALVGPLKRNLPLSLAEAEFFRVIPASVDPDPFTRTMATRGLARSSKEATFGNGSGPKLGGMRWSARILDEAERAIAKLIAERGIADAAEKATRARDAMERAFEDAAVTGYEDLMSGFKGLPDPG